MITNLFLVLLLVLTFSEHENKQLKQLSFSDYNVKSHLENDSPSRRQFLQYMKENDNELDTRIRCYIRYIETGTKTTLLCKELDLELFNQNFVNTFLPYTVVESET